MVSKQAVNTHKLPVDSEHPMPPPFSIGPETTQLPGPTRPGRPRTGTDETRRQQAIEAAEQLFKTNGFIGSTMSDVARLAGMSKKTIYTVFESKDALLSAVLERHFQPLAVPLEPEDGRSIEETLSNLLLRTLTFVLAPAEIQFVRLLVAEETRSSQASPLMEQLDVLHQSSTLTAWMARQAAVGAIQIEDPAVAAEMLIGMGLGELHISLLLGAIDPPTPALLAERAARTARIFLRGVLTHEEG